MAQQLPSVEDLEQRISDGRQASGAFRVLLPFVDTLTSDITRQLARDAMTLTTDQMRVLVGEIAGLQRLRARLETQMETGKIAAERRDGR